MTSEKKTESNRRNAEKSSGPQSPEGINRSRFNAVRHGLCGASVLLPWENAEEFEDFRKIILQDLQPEGPVEYKLAMRVADCLWLLDRGEDYKRSVAEASIYRDRMMQELVQVSVYEGRIERSMIRCLRTLRQLRKEREGGPRVTMPEEYFLTPNAQFPEGEDLSGPHYAALPLESDAMRRELLHRAKERYAQTIRDGLGAASREPLPYSIERIADVQLGIEGLPEPDRSGGPPLSHGNPSWQEGAGDGS